MSHYKNLDRISTIPHWEREDVRETIPSFNRPGRALTGAELDALHDRYAQEISDLALAGRAIRQQPRIVKLKLTYSHPRKRRRMATSDTPTLLLHRRVCPSLRLTRKNGYDLTVRTNGYTDDVPAFEDLYLAATRNQSSAPAMETKVTVWNHVSGEKYPNGTIPPYEFGVSPDEGVLTVYRSYKADDVIEAPRRVHFSDVMFGTWKICLAANKTTATEPESTVTNIDAPVVDSSVPAVETQDTVVPDLQPLDSSTWLRKRKRKQPEPSAPATEPDSRLRRLKFVAVQEICNVQFELVARWAFSNRGLAPETDILIVDSKDIERECNMYTGAEPCTMFEAFLGTPTVKSIQRMAADNRDALGHVFPQKLYIRWGVFDCPSEPDGKAWAPCLLAEMG
ncbi:hypothetical protein ABW21_db0203718 [Orbilia brochopaga]|nr:hypothetical protein ABW21_db0203718 [Drechslerella brochopaga]